MEINESRILGALESAFGRLCQYGFKVDSMFHGKYDDEIRFRSPQAEYGLSAIFDRRELLTYIVVWKLTKGEFIPNPTKIISEEEIKEFGFDDYLYLVAPDHISKRIAGIADYPQIEKSIQQAAKSLFVYGKGLLCGDYNQICALIGKRILARSKGELEQIQR